MSSTRTLRILDRLALIVGGLAVVVILVLVLAEITVRAAGSGLPFTSEYSSLAMAWLIFLPLAEVTRRRTHIAADFLVERMNPRLGAWVTALGASLFLVLYVAALFYVGWTVTANSFAENIRSQGLMMTPLFYPQVGMMVGLGLMLLRASVELARSVVTALHVGADTAA
ncbi:MAG: hypothetical protein TEF_08620 [Rhizobiales bacterium NRL2]|jgi:TRAP-type C4-dicarboxylate transport system permease small subunit|nr:MAG: hypothetical protein TEF_08620 [Rhizobiales bacterium NRL2]